MKDVHDIIRECERRPNEQFALATLVRARGSSYRRPGARMLIARDGRTIGSLSGGCLEEEVAVLAQEVLRSGRAGLTSFDTRQRFGCNGAIDIFIEPLQKIFVAELSANLSARQSCRVETVFEKQAHAGGTRVVAFGESENEHGFQQTIHPQPRLIIFGDGPDSDPLRALCAILGWQTIEAAQASELPREADQWTAAIIKSHNYGRDFSALQTLLPMSLRYLGLIGPRRRRDQLMADVLDSGTSANAELFAPTGLDLGSETPAEIALAIVAEVQRAFAGGTGASLREVKTPIHQAEPWRAAVF
ncbi:MAG: XdhC family protein [Chthoniobacterales bacterium]